MELNLPVWPSKGTPRSRARGASAANAPLEQTSEQTATASERANGILVIEVTILRAGPSLRLTGDGVALSGARGRGRSQSAHGAKGCPAQAGRQTSNWP